MQHDEVRVEATPVKSFLSSLDQDLTAEQRAEVFRSAPSELSKGAPAWQWEIHWAA